MRLPIVAEFLLFWLEENNIIDKFIFYNKLDFRYVDDILRLWTGELDLL